MQAMMGKQNFDKASSFVRGHARPVDQALFAYQFEGGPASAVVREVAMYQNPDGGFGNAIEPDFRLPDSSAIASTVAFQYLTDVGISSSDQTVRRGIGYFIESYDSTIRGWHPTPASVNDYPHAPWWHVNENGMSGVGEMGWANPSAEVAAYLFNHAQLVPDDFLTELVQTINDEIAALSEAIPPHAMNCLVHLAESRFPSPTRHDLTEKLKASAMAGSRHYPDWPGPGAHVIGMVSSPKSLLVDSLGKALEADLDHAVESQDEVGAWSPGWSWAAMYPDAWPQAEAEWRGVLTVKTLGVLRAFGRIEGVR